MYAIRLRNGYALGHFSLVLAVGWLRNNAVVVAVVRRLDGKEVLNKVS